MSKRFLFGFMMGTVLLVVGRVAAQRTDQTDTKQSTTRAELSEYQAAIATATPVRLGELTDKQRKHSQLFGHYRNDTSLSMSKLAAQTKDQRHMIVGFHIGVGLRGLPSGSAVNEKQEPEVFFGNLANESDAVIRCRVVGKSSQLTEDGAFIFTDYDFVVTEVFKNNVAAPLGIGARNVVTRPGGQILLDGVIVSASDESFRALPVNGSDIVLFLRFLPATGDYTTTRDAGAWGLDGGLASPLSGAYLPHGIALAPNDFQTMLRRR